MKFRVLGDKAKLGSSSDCPNCNLIIKDKRINLKDKKRKKEIIKNWGL